jgi:hypothetical protein
MKTISKTIEKQKKEIELQRDNYRIGVSIWS